MRTPDGRPVYLAAEAQEVWLGLHLGAEPRAVLCDVPGLVRRQLAEVERVEGRPADAADAGRERSQVRAGRVPANQRYVTHRSAPAPRLAPTPGRRALRAACGAAAPPAPPRRAGTPAGRARRDRRR